MSIDDTLNLLLMLIGIVGAVFAVVVGFAPLAATATAMAVFSFVRLKQT